MPPADFAGDAFLPRLSRDECCASMVLDSLAWAVRHDLPLPVSLARLPFQWPLGRLPRILRALTPLVRTGLRQPFWAGLVLMASGLILPVQPQGFAFVAGLLAVAGILLLAPVHRIRWTWMTKLLVVDLERGRPLSEALRRTMGNLFPGYILSGLDAAEAGGDLRAALPVLARRLRNSRSPAGSTTQLRFVHWKVLLLSGVALVAFQIGGQISDVFEPRLEPGSLAGARIATAVLGVVQVIAVLLLIGPIRRWCARWFPPLRRESDRVHLIDAFESIRVFARGGNLVEAVDAAARASRLRRNRADLARTAADMRAGGNWLDALGGLRCHSGLTLMILREAERLEDPDTAFDRIVAWAREDLGRDLRQFTRWVEIAFVCALGVAVGLALWSGARWYGQILDSLV